MNVQRYSRWLIRLLVSLMVMWTLETGAAIAQMPPRPSSPAIPALERTTNLQPYLDRVQQQITEFQLDNGIRFIVLEQHRAPVISFVTYADVGGVDETPGKTGVAHFLEHLAFKGTQRIGTQDYESENKLMTLLDQLDRQIQQARQAGATDGLPKLQAEFNKVKADASRLVKQNELGRIVEQAGGVDLNANTSTDATRYFYSFPSNKLELWMSLESERFLEPVFREFYEEKAVILEERRLRVENSPVGQLIEAVLEKAYTIHPYRRPVIGYLEDIQNLSRSDVSEFFANHYTPGNLTFAIAGDTTPSQVKRLAESYFGRYKARPTPMVTLPAEPRQTTSQTVTLQLTSQPIYLEGYHRPALNHPDHAVYELLTSLLSDGRASRLYHSLVEQQRVALSAQGFSGFPGDKYPNLLVFYALPAPDRSLEDLEKALQTELERLKTEPVTLEELNRVKNQAQADLLRSLGSNMGMAQLLAEYAVKTGNWRNLFQQLEQIRRVTPADIQRVAQATFRSENKTVGRITPLAPLKAL